MTDKISFGQWLKQRRKALDLTREDLAGQVGCAAVTIYKIEADERRPSKQIAALLADHLNIALDERTAFVGFARAEAVESAIPWGTPFHPQTNLPAQPTLLIGRDEDVAAIHKRLHQPETRLLTLTGPPGIGKTRLALQVATQALDDFIDGVFFIALAPISDANLVPTTIANTLGLPAVGPQTPLEHLKAFLRDRQILLVLDNFEQILAAGAQIAELLTACTWLKMIVTSRAPLRIRQERQIPVSPLAVPDLASLPDVEGVIRYAAVTLFLERAQAVQPGFSLTPENVPIIAAICTRLDGLPLAIELISARVKLLSPAALLERLSGRLMLQSDGLRDLEPRHRTLNAAIDWSYQLLSADEQTLFQRLGVFVRGWALESAESVCMGHLNLNILDGLASLLDKNLVKQDTRSDGEPRFMMLETIREYALQQLVASGELEALQRHHADYFLKLAEGAEAHAFGREQIARFDRLEVEFDNLRAAFAWSLRSEEVETGLQLAAAVGWFFSERAHLKEGFDWLERMLTANPEAPPSLRAKALHSAGALAGIHRDERRARALCEQALALARPLNDRWNIAWSLSHLAIHLENQPDQSAALLDESLVLFRELEDAMGVAHTLLRRSWFALVLEDYAYMRLLLEEAAIRAGEAGDKIITGWVTLGLGKLSWNGDHDLTRARTLSESSLSLFREARFQIGIDNALTMLARLAQAMGNMEHAQLLNQEVLISVRKSAPYIEVPIILARLANIARVRGQLERAARLLGVANRGVLAAKRDISELDNFDGEVAEVRAQLGEAAFAEAWAAGSAMTREQADAYALALAGDS